MKPFVISLVLLFLVVSFVVWNAIATDNMFQAINQQLERLPQDSAQLSELSEHESAALDEALDQLVESWNRYKTYIAFTVADDEMDRFSIPLLQAKSAFQARDYSSYLVYLASAKESLSHLADFEKLSFENIM